VDLLEFESGGERAATPDITEVCNYVEALKYARAQMVSPKGLPLSVRLLNETHRLLMRGVRGASKAPGEVRRTQNWIGGSRPGNAAFVPPPPNQLPKALAALEKYIHGSDKLPPLIRAGLFHVQFETIHPYLDGNGRIGRLLISLLLEHWKLLSQPLLYLSLFFKRHHTEYYRRLSIVRAEGDWEGWLDFFLDGVATVGEEAVTSARELFATVATDRERVLNEAAASVAALRLFELLPGRPPPGSILCLSQIPRSVERGNGIGSQSRMTIAYAVLPASIVSVVPVTLRPPSPSKNSTLRATSIGSGMRFMALRRAICSRCFSSSS
jgi:hypothetical protein